MDIRVSGHQIETGEALQAHAQERLSGIVGKYFSRALSSTITFNRAPAGAFRADIVTHVMQGLVLKGAGIAHDAHIAFDQAAEKIDKQLRRYKRRLKDRHEAAQHAVKTEEAAYTVFVEPDAEVEEVTIDAPVVIAGDFNTTDYSPLFQEHWSEYPDAFSELGWGLGYTYVVTRTQIRIDHVLATPGIRLASFRLSPRIGSPHRPLLVDLELLGDGTSVATGIGGASADGSEAGGADGR